MEVRVKIGRYAGEVRDVVNDIAHAMIADGRAEDPRFDELELQSPVVSEVSMPTSRARKSRRS